MRTFEFFFLFFQSTEKLIKFKAEEFEIGKRHLAKMMGENVDTFNQADIDVGLTNLIYSAVFNINFLYIYLLESY